MTKKSDIGDIMLKEKFERNLNKKKETDDFKPFKT